MMREIVIAAYTKLFFDQLVYGAEPKMVTFTSWKGALTPAERIVELEHALEYELWLETEGRVQ